MTKSQLETDIFNYKTPEFYINMKSIPDKTSKERKDFVLEEKRKCREGININGIYIPGGLYMHLNYYHLEGDDEKNPGKKKVMLPTLRDNEWIIFNDYDLCQKTGKIYPLFGGRQISKDLLNSSLLYKEDGEITIGDCNVGDKIYDDSGKLATIVGKYPQGVKPVYKMTLIDGREIFCGLEHNWYVWDRLKEKYFKKSTKELLIDYKKQRKSWIGKRKNSYEFRYSIPNNKAVQYPEKELPIDPYIFGLWLGDGSNTYSKITNIDKEIIDFIYEYANKVGLQITADGDTTYMITSGKNGGNKKDFQGKNFFHNYLKNSNLYNNKHIPKEYFYSSEEQRMELLRGLMDSDGYISKKDGIIGFSSSIPKLSEDFYKLCRSLGINLSKKTHHTYYIKDGKKIKCKDAIKFTLFTDKKVFKLSRKLERLFTKPKYLDKTSIVDIQYVFDAETTCIEVNNESHLFLTDNYTITHNTESEVSLCLRELSLYTPTEAIALFATDTYKDTFVKKARAALQHGEKFIYVPNIDKDWNKSEIRFGLTKQDNSIDLRGILYIYNTQEGKKIQVGSGKSPSFLLFDEAAASPFNSVLNTMLPAMLTDFGNYRCSPMITFTGGETDKAEDAKNMVESPSEEKQFTTILEDGKKIGGRFMDGRYRKDCKKPSTISKYTSIKTNTWIDDYPIMVTDFEYAINKINKEREEASKHPDKNTLTLQKIFYPLTIEDVFLTESNNKFPVTTIKAHQQWLKEHYEPMYVDLYRDIDGKVKWKNSDRKPINKFPVKPKDDKLAPLCVYELPVKDAPNFTYVIGGDPINNDDSSDKEVSLFTLCVYKRMISPLDKFKNQVVASIAYRPNELRETHEMALMLCEFYNAVEGFLPEGSEASLIQYFYLKRKGHYLAQSFNLQTEVIAKKNIKGAKKVSLPATTINQKHYMNLLVEEANKEEIELDEEGNEIYTLGVTKEHDIMLLEEYSNYKSKVTGRGIHDGNYDRIIARGCAETLARYYDIVYPIAQQISIKQTRPQEVNYRAKSTFWGSVELKPKSTLFDDIDKKPTAKLPSWMRGK